MMIDADDDRDDDDDDDGDDDDEEEDDDDDDDVGFPLPPNPPYHTKCGLIGIYILANR